MADKSKENHQDAEEQEEALARKWPWLLPLASGIFIGGAGIEMMPDAIQKAGLQAWIWAAVGLAFFIFVRDGLDYIGRRGMAWVATLGIWLHSFLEGAVTATSYGVSFIVGLLVSAGMILHLIPEVGAVIALLVAAGLSFKQALIRNGVTWALLVIGFVVTFFFLRNLPDPVLGGLLAFGAGGFLYLAYLSWKERKWELAPSLAIAAVGVLLVGGLRLIAG